MNIKIQKLIYWQLKAAQKDQGFITLEVIVALIVGLAFFAVSLQAFGVSVAMKAQAIEQQRANELIQEDIERISQLGNNPTLTGVCEPTGADAAAEYGNGYADGLWNALIAAVPEDDQDLTKAVSNKVITGTGAGAGTIRTGGRTLALRRVHVSNNGATESDPNDPHRTLKVGYQVWYGDTTTNTFLNRAGVAATPTDEAIAETYVEIIPDVALSCP